MKLKLAVREGGHTNYADLAGKVLIVEDNTDTSGGMMQCSIEGGGPKLYSIHGWQIESVYLNIPPGL